MANEKSKQVIVVSPTKSMGVSIILTVIFGPLGMFYSTIMGAIIMFVISAVVGLVTLGWGCLVTWPICIVWGAISTSSYNKKLLSGQKQY